eukprot:4322592-Pyramimonas_sp.AAC.1
MGRVREQPRGRFLATWRTGEAGRGSGTVPALQPQCGRAAFPRLVPHGRRGLGSCRGGRQGGLGAQRPATPCPDRAALGL